MVSSRATKGSEAELDSIGRWLWATLALITLWRLWAAWILPVTQDEAYYFDWARSLAWGYFDHPPGVALLGIGTLFAPANALAGRLGTVLVSSLTLLVLVRLYRFCGLRGGELVVAVAIVGVTLPGLASGVLATPDTALGLGWALALHEGLAALRGQRRRWLSAGIVTGLGLLGKYTMALIGPVFLWAILWADPKALRTPWPYLGGLLALLVFSPNLIWNADNDWLTIRFQFGHGFSTDSGSLVTNALPAPIGEPDIAAAQFPEEHAITERLGSLLSFLGTQVALWGLLAVPVTVGLLRRHETRRRKGLQGMDSAVKALLVSGSLFPLVFFALVATFSEVEPNWPAMYLSTAAPLVAVALCRLRVSLLVAAGANLLVASLYVLHGATAMLPLLDSQNRILRETHGFEELARRLSALPGPVFSDRYQIVAMLRFFEPSVRAAQWPGVSRPSEYLRGRIAAPVTGEQIEHAGGFWLLSRRYVPLAIPGATLRSQSSLFFCMSGGLIEVPADGVPPCQDPLHRWQLFAYASDPAP